MAKVADLAKTNWRKAWSRGAAAMAFCSSGLRILSLCLTGGFLTFLRGLAGISASSATQLRARLTLVMAPRRVYICSRRGNAAELGSAIRGHWGIENGLHWVLDVIFREDDSRLKDRTAAENLGMLRRVAVSLLRQGPSKGSVSGKLRRAAWDDEFRLHLLHLLSGESA
jgi:hypothetical protein